MTGRYNIAIVGMGCILPGAHDLDQYWRNIVSGRNFFTEMPKDRWDFDHFWSADPGIPNRSYSKIGAFISDFEFPFLDYRLPPSTMKEVDLTQLVTLEATKQALLDAGLSPRDERLSDAITVLGLSGVDEWARLTVYLRRHDFLEDLAPRLHAQGVDPTQVAQLAEQFGEVLDKSGYHYESATAAVGAVPSSVSNRVAQVFGIRGFNMTVDAACASSFTALQLACDALIAGDAKIAITGGADLGINPAIYVGFSRVSGLSRSGHANPFDDSADGLIIGEGVGIIVLKKLEDALAEGDRVHAVIQGVGSSSDGAGNAIYAPSAEGRAECVRRALKSAERAPRDVHYIEAHATSTVVGDGNEYDSLGMAYGQHADPDNPVSLGSVKGQIGHIKAAAGAAGLIKTVLGMKHGQIPHMPKFSSLTTEATYDGPGLRVPTEMEPWEPNAEGLRIAGVTASGFGGINYHVIVEQGEQYEPPLPRQPVDRRLAVVGMSCRTPGAGSPEELVDHLMAGDELFTDVNHQQLGWQSHVNVPQNEWISAKRIGQVDDTGVNPAKFRIFPTAVSQIAKAQLLGLELTDELLEQLQIDKRSSKHIAVSVGSMHNDHFGEIWMNMLDSVYTDAVRRCDVFPSIDATKREKALEEALASFMDRFPPSSEHTLPGWMTNCLSGRIANTFNFNGPNCVVDSACSSGVASFVPVMYELAFGRSTMAIAGGINRSHNSEMAIGVTSLGAVSDDVARPFDINGHGFLMSEGGALFALKRLEDAEKDGDTIYSVIHGIDGSSEADSKSMVAPSASAVRVAVRGALEQTGVDPKDIAVVDVHGSANRASDLIEIEALAEELRPDSNDDPVLVTAVKSHIGHLYGGSGVTSAMSVIGSLNRGMAPGVRNLSVPHPEVLEFHDRARPPQVTTQLPPEARFGAVQSLGLGGANFVMVLGRGAYQATLPSLPPPPERERASAMTSPFEGLSAPSRITPAVAVAAPVAKPSPAIPPAPMAKPAPVAQPAPAVRQMLAPTHDGFPSVLAIEAPDRHGIRALIAQAKSTQETPAVLSMGFERGQRVVLTHSSREDLLRKLDALDKVLDSNTDPRPLEGLGVHTSWAGGAGKQMTTADGLAFCFPGQGVQYPGMGRCLYERYPVFRNTIDEVHALAAEKFGFDLIANMYGYTDESAASQAMGTLVGVQTSVFAVELGTARVLESLGAKPDVMIGHSFGEFAALTFAGVWDLPTGYAAVAARIEAAEISRTFGNLGMMSLICEPDQRDVILSLAGAGIQLTNINAPTQAILAGPADELERAQAMAEASGADARILQIASAFHSTYMEPARGPFREALAGLECSDPRIAVLSTVNGRHYPTAGLTSELLAEHLSRQLVTGIDFPRDISTMYANGIRHFIEVGPKWSVTRMVGAILEGKDFRSSPSLQPKVGDAEMFERSRSFLISTGHLSPHQGYGKKPSTNDAAFLSYLVEEEPHVATQLEQAISRFGSSDVRKPAPAVATPSQSVSVTMTTSPVAVSEPSVTSAPPVPVSVPVATATPAAPAPVATRPPAHFANAMRQMLAERTGYPEDLLTDDVDLEGDLGIDSVLRAEIWSEILQREGLDPKTKPSKVRSIGELAVTLADAASATGGSVAAVAPIQSQTQTTAVPTVTAPVAPVVTAAGKDAAYFASQMRTMLAERTGYPEDLLTDDVDLEGDLGIDSVLRAEIWSEILQREGLDPKTKPSKVRSIGELAVTLADASGGAAPDLGVAPTAPQSPQPTMVAPPALPNPPAIASGGKDAAYFASQMRTMLAERTGYPEDLLTDDVDLEGDLGIDSVLRAEIWTEILKAEGLDPKTRPSKVRSIGELAVTLADATVGSAIPAAPTAPIPVIVQTPPTAATAGGLQVQESAPANVPMQAASAKDSAFYATLMRTMLAERTGYPEDLLTNDVDLEGDLGIDSVLRAEIWTEILKAEGLDPKTRPSKVRSIGELAQTLSEAALPSESVQPEVPAVVVQPAAVAAPPRPEARPEVVPEPVKPKIELPPCILNRAVVVDLPEHEVTSFACNRVLHFTGHPKSDDEVGKMLASQGIEVDVMDAETAAGDGATLDKMLERCDTVIFTAHGGLASGRAKAGRIAGSLKRETLKLFGVFRAIKRHLVKMPRRILFPITLDGCFGLEDAGRDLLGTFPAGFVLSLQRELPDCTFQLIDSGSRSWAEALSEHLFIVSGLSLVGKRGKTLVTIEHEPVPVTERTGTPLERGDTVLVTGGARGIVFECMHALARETGCNLILTGRTDRPPKGAAWLTASDTQIDAEVKKAEVELARSSKMSLGEARKAGRTMRSQWELHQNMTMLESENIEVHYETCDVSSIDALRKLVKKLTKQGKKINGMVHGAGVQRSAMIEDLPDERVILTLETKMIPLLVLSEALNWDDLKLFVSFGSVTGAFGNEGQTDYALANFLLTGAGRVLRKAHPKTLVQTLEWTAWTGTGMVTEREAENFAAQGLTVLDVRSGVDLFIDSVLSPTPEVQVSVFNPGSAFTMPRARAVINRRTTLLEGGTQTARFSPQSDEFLDQHKLNGQPVVPGTFVIELFAEATASQHPASLENVHFRRPMWIRREDHGVEVVMEGSALRALPEQRPDVPARALTNLQYASAVIGDPTPRVEQVPMADEEEMATLRARASDGEGMAFYSLLDDAFRDSLDTGPIFRGLRATVNDEERCVGLVELTPEAQDQFQGDNDLLFNPVVSDMAVQVASSWAMERLMVMAIPSSAVRVEMLKPLEKTEALVCCKLVSMDEDQTVVDLTVRETDGTVCYAINELTLRSIARINQ